MATDTTVSELIINKLTKAQYDAIQNPSDTELYLVPDEEIPNSTIITNDGSDGDSVAIKLTESGSYHRTFRIDMTAEYTGGANEQRIGSLIIECYSDSTEGICHGYYYGDTLSDILTEVAVYQDDQDSGIFYLMLTHESSLDSVTFAISPTDGGEVDAIITNAADDHTKVDDATISPVGSGGSSDVFVAEYGVTPFNDVMTAYNAGKVCVCERSGYFYIFSMEQGNSAPAYFSCAISGRIFWVRVNTNNTWANGSYNLEDKANKVSSISGNETDTTKYPNTKAVADYVSDIVGDIETLLAAI